MAFVLVSHNVVVLNSFAYITLLLPMLCYSHGSPRATYYERPDGLGTPSGACGYGEYGRTVNDGDVTAVSKQSIYRNGAGCGACYQIKCKEAGCNGDGVKVVVTDSAINDDKDFILSSHAFAKLALPGKDKELKAYGIVSIDYQRVPCTYPGKNVMIQILEHSKYPNYLSLVFLYQGGVYDIDAVEVFEATSVEWRSCQRSYGAVWHISNPPRTALTMRIFLAGTATVSARWVLLPNVIPAFWRANAVIDTAVQIS